MFTIQKQILEFIPTARQLFLKHKYAQDKLTSIEKMASHFFVRVPLVGAFSCGKSSLLNAIIGEKLFATSIDPQTAVPAELSYNRKESLLAYTQDGKETSVSRAQIQENQLAPFQPNGWLDVQLPHEQLAAFPHLRLVDMPGWDSGNTGHTKAIDEYAARSLAYCIVVSAEEGTLHESIRLGLQELNLHEMPIIAVISKCDKKPTEDIDAIAAQVSAEIKKLIGKDPLAIVKVSSSKKNIASFLQALNDLENLAQPLFVQNVLKPFLSELSQFSDYLDTLINRDDLDSAQIALQRERIAHEVRNFDQQLEEETQRLDQSLPSISKNIQARIKADLTAQLDSLASIALRNGDLGTPITQSLRIATSSGFKEEFEPKLHRYLGKVTEIVPSNFKIDLRLPDARPVETDPTSAASHEVLKGVALIGLTKLIALIPLPQAKALAFVIGPIVELFSKFLKSSSQKELAEAQRREDARQHILNSVIPQVLADNEDNLREGLYKHVQQIKEGITAAVEQQRQSLQAALSELEMQLAKGKASFDKVSAIYQEEQTSVLNMVKSLEQA